MSMHTSQPDQSDHAQVDTDAPVSSEQAKQLILAGAAPAGLRVRGRLTFQRSHFGLRGGKSGWLEEAPSALPLPSNLTVTCLDISDLPELCFLPPNLTCYELNASGSGLRSLPASLRVEFRLNLSNCTRLETLPEGLRVGSLILRGCTALPALPEGLAVYFLDISGCTSLTDWPQQAAVQIGRLDARGCTRLRNLPPWLTSVAQLNLCDCVSLAELPDTLRVTSWIDLANTRITHLPTGVQRAQLRWRGVPINERIAFHPETITVSEVLHEPNAERRRVLLERMGYEIFLSQADAQILNQDADPGGERRLLRVRMPDDEDLVCLAVYCPSTGRQYMLRVPPRMRTCHQAAAWIAGFDDPNDYRPLKET